MSSTATGVTVISVQDASNANSVNLSSAILDLNHVLGRPLSQILFKLRLAEHYIWLISGLAGFTRELQNPAEQFMPLSCKLKIQLLTLNSAEI